MRLVATLLLIVMAGLFLATLAWHGAHPAVPWMQAFAEAALVGGLADWFAVTALFRHPLGLPIPHTAIIPANKDRIGDSLAAFLKDNFLTPGVVARRLDAIDIASAIANWLVTERPPPTGKPRGIGPLLARIVEALDQKAIGDLVRDIASSRLNALALSPIVADRRARATARRCRPVCGTGQHRPKPPSRQAGTLTGCAVAARTAGAAGMQACRG